jgi:hypothetical protein
MGMNMSMIAFVGMATVAVLFMAAMVVLELDFMDFKLSALTQSGDSSLGKKSVNWLAGIAFSAAVLICLF